MVSTINLNGEPNAVKKNDLSQYSNRKEKEGDSALSDNEDEMNELPY